jgi:hypothetical protein
MSRNIASKCIGCPTLSGTQRNPSDRTNYDALTRVSSSYKLFIHVNTLLQSFHPLEKNLN